MQHNRCGPAQGLAKAVTATADDLCSRGNALTIRWTPSHEGVKETNRPTERPGWQQKGKKRGPGRSISERPVSPISCEGR